MPKRKKDITELTDEELMPKLFHKKVRDKLKEVAHEKDKKEDENECK